MVDVSPPRKIAPSRPRLPTPWLQRGLGCITAAFLAWAVADYPSANGFLGIALLAYAGLSLRFPGLWLCLLPALLPVVNLAPWSGRYFYEEFDFFVLLTLALALWQGHYDPRRRLRLPPLAGLLCFLFLASCVVACVRGLLPLETPDANSFSSYYSHYNALRLLRGFAWPFLLAPPLLAEMARDRSRAKLYLSAGVVYGLLATGIAVLWERGFFHTLLHASSLYEIAGNLLNFSTDYRITALFAEMHSGGEAIDGYLAMSWPFAAYALFRRNPPALFWAGLLALPLGLYSALVTFSRGTYLAVAVSALVLVLGAARRVQGGRARRLSFALPPALAALGYLSVLAFRHGGMLSLATLLLEFAAATAAGYLYASLRAGTFLAALAALLGLSVALVARAQVTSKWMAAELPEALWTATGLGLAMAGLGLAAGWSVRRHLQRQTLAVAVFCVVCFTGVLVPSLFGYRMEARFTDVGRDGQTRLAHWRHAVELMDEDWSTRWFGMGLGVFPRAYVFNREQDEGGTHALRREAGNRFLTLSGGKDLRFGQRIGLPARRSYRFSLEYRTGAERAQLHLRVCRRHIIHPTEWNPECRSFDPQVHSTSGQWTPLVWVFDIGELGDGFGSFTRWPLLLEIKNRREYDLMEKPPALVDIDNIQLLDETGNDRIENGDFEAGMDHWYPYYDFNHLPWHIKNVWVDMYFEQGWFGLAGFAALLLYSGVRALRGLAADGGFSLAVLAAMLGFLAVGLVGTLLDVPRILLLFFLLLFGLFPARDKNSERIVA